MLEYLAPRDQDLSWFFSTIVILAEYYPKLKESAFLNESIYTKIAEDTRLIHNAEIVRQFDCLTVEHFRLAFTICQHLYVRLTDKRNQRGDARSLIRRGICVLYHYVYCYIGRNSEQTILKQIQHLQDIQIKRVDPADELHEWCLMRFRQAHGIFAPEPAFIIYVPWTQYLSLVGRKHGDCPLRDGYAYIVYTQAAKWISERWKCIIRAWQDHDHAIIDPWFIHQYAIHKPTIDKHAEEAGRHSGSHTIWKSDYYDKHFYDAARDMLLKGKYYDYDEIARPYFDPIVSLDPLYNRVFALGRDLDMKLTCERRSKSTKNDLDFHNETETNDFYVDYGGIMPPCIKHMFESHTLRRTHFKNADRLTFFSWTFMIGLPLSTVNKMWTTMCSADSQISKRDIPGLLAVPNDLYRRYTLNKQRGQTYNFKGCASMSQHCIFSELEDIVARKEMCSQAVCGSNDGRPLPTLKWSPMLATIILHKRKHIEVELDGDLV